MTIVAGLTVALITLLGGSSGGSASPVTVGSITLSPQAVSLSNPASRGRRGTPQPRIPVSLGVLDSQGNAITSGTFAQPIKLRVYGPSSRVLTALTPVIRSPRSMIYFRYTGGYVANSIIVTAVSGHAFALMSFQLKHRGFPGTGSVTFRMPNTSRNFSAGWFFTASIGGGRAHVLQMDTGSRGIVAPAAVFGPGAVGPGPPGKIEYSSSGKIFLGHYYLAPVKLSAGGTSVTTVPIEVLGVQQAACDPNYPKCVPGKVGGVGLTGVGFARAGIVPSTPPELTNSLLALTNIIQGSMHPGYIVTAKSVTVGITAADQAGYGKIPLQPGGTGPGDWNTGAGCFGFPNISGYGALCGTVLVDTGIGGAILGLAPAQRPPSIASTIPTGVRIRIAAPNTTSPAFSYAFTTGDGGPMTPTGIRWAGGKAPFVNTGRRPIARVKYLFDAGSGRVGFKSVKP